MVYETLVLIALAVIIGSLAIYNVHQRYYNKAIVCLGIGFVAWAASVGFMLAQFMRG